MKRNTGFKTQPSTYRLSLAPTGRACCRGCKGRVAKGELRLETSAFVRPGRRTVFVRHACATCVPVALARDVLAVYGSMERVPVGPEVDPSMEAEARQMMLQRGGALREMPNTESIKRYYLQPTASHVPVSRGRGRAVSPRCDAVAALPLALTPNGKPTRHARAVTRQRLPRP